MWAAPRVSDSLCPHGPLTPISAKCPLPTSLPTWALSSWGRRVWWSEGGGPKGQREEDLRVRGKRVCWSEGGGSAGQREEGQVVKEKELMVRGRKV